MTKYNRLTQDERYKIAVHRDNGKSIGWIARTLGRNHATISRELVRNRGERGYVAQAAQEKAKERLTIRNRKRCKIQGSLLDSILEKLQEYWSPQQISGWLKEKKDIRVSHETIYQKVVYAPECRWYLRPFLRHGGRKYQRRDKRKYAGRGYIPGRVDIDERPPIVNEKSRLGDWELDTIVGGNHQGYLVSMVERHSKYTLLMRVANSCAKTVKDAIIQALTPYKGKVLTLTADNGKEFSDHQDIATTLGASFYFAKPYHSWERGLNEHTNGLVRQFFKKGTDFLQITDDAVAHVQNLLNNRPRAALNFNTPQQVFAP